MPTPLLATKLHIPPLRPSLVRRARLVERLDHGRARKLTLVSAPAGFGKTTLVTEWLADCGCPIAWVSLDERDAVLGGFLTYLIAALQTIQPEIGGVVLDALQSPNPTPIETTLTALINEINRVSARFIVVLDDYHTLDSPDVDGALTFLLDHLPPQMHLVIATREDPSLPLARLRARNQLTEVRAADLRFTLDEAADFLGQGMGLALGAADIGALQARTEGWIVGLQLAALALQGSPTAQHGMDVTGFIQAFSGSHRFVLDYLVEEVLDRQPLHIQHFLLSTSVLDRLCGPLCEAVTDSVDLSGQAMLEYCEQANLMLIPLDDQRQWYRYHHLFGEVLRARLMKTLPEQVIALHQRASDWYAQTGLFAEAIHHAFAAEDFERAAALVERAWPSIRQTRQEAIFRPWVKALPNDLIRQRPVLSVICAWALLDAGEFDAVEARLRDAERLLDTSSEDYVVIDEQQFQSLPAAVANARAYRAQALNDLPGTVRYTRLALDLLAADDYYERGTTAALLGLAYWASGDLESAYDSFARGLDDLERGGGILIRMGGTIVLAHIRSAQGRLHAAADAYRQSLQRSTAHGEPLLKGTAEMYLGLADISLEHGEVAQAEAHLASGANLRQRASLPGYDYLWCMVEARLKLAAGDLDAMFALMHEAEHLYYRSPIPDVRPVSAMRARLLLLADRLPEALAWVRGRGLSADDDLSYLREYEHFTLARILLAQHRKDGGPQPLADAQRLLTRLFDAAEAGGRIGSIIEARMLQALALDSRGDTPAALKSLSHALTLAEREGYFQLFVDEGRPMAALLEKAAAHRLSAYAGKLLAAFDTPSAPAPRSVTLPALIDPLSERELEVLRLLKTELSGPEIADLLGVALSTVRTHTKHIYDKLDATNRRAAVNRAEALGLI